ncbi:hypothetical protein [Kaarinaea lacus]
MQTIIVIFEALFILGLLGFVAAYLYLKRRYRHNKDNNSDDGSVQ